MPIFGATCHNMYFVIYPFRRLFGIKVKLTLGMDNLFNYIPKTLGSGITMFNVPATAGARGWVQVEFMLDDVINSLKKKK